jgi:transposase
MSPACVSRGETTSRHGRVNPHKLSLFSKGGFLVDNYIGIDVASKTLQVYDGKKNVEIPNTEKLAEFKELLQNSFHKDWKKVRILYEPTGVYSSYVELFAGKYSLQAYAINPKKSHNFARAMGNRSKTDPIDAKMLYNYHKLVEESEWKVPQFDQDLDSIAHDLATYELIQKSWVQMENHLRSLKRGKMVNASVVSFLEEEVKRLKKQEEVLVVEMEKKTKSSGTMREDFARLTSIPGIGAISAIVLLMMFRRYSETNRSEITSLVGLDPTRYSSGTSIQKQERISKQGNHFARKVLYMAAMVAYRNNDRMKVFYARLIEHQKKPKVALIAVMRKLVLIAHQLYVKKEYYVPLT